MRGFLGVIMETSPIELNSNKQIFQKVLALGIVITIIILVDMHNIHPLLKESTQLDPNWNTSPGYLFLHDNQILGRDSIFTYGPLFQLFSVMGAKLHVSESSIFSLHLIYFIQEETALFLLAFSLLLIPFIGWKLAIILILLINPAVNLRVTLLIFSISMLSYSFTVFKRNKRILLGVLVGVLAFVSQIYLFNLGLYAIALTIVLGIFFSLVSRQSKKLSAVKHHQFLKPKEYLYSIAAVLAVYIALNLLLSVVFMSTSENYRSLFQYQELSLSIVKGYTYLMGRPVPWIPPYIRVELLFLGIFLFGIILTISRCRELKIEEFYFFMSYFVLAGIMLKSVLIRSDFTHLVIGLRGVYFLGLIVIGHFTTREPMRLRKIALGGIFILFSFFNGLYNPGSFIYDLSRLVASPAPFKNFNEAREFFPDHETIQENYYLLPEEYQIEEKIIDLGYRNYVAEFYDMELDVPVLQDYATITPDLSNYYIQMIGLEEYPIILYEYGFLLDSIFQGTRYPDLYRFLLENYHAPDTKEIDYQSGFMILEKRDSPNEFVSNLLNFSATKSNQGNISIIFQEPINCKLLEMKLSMKYPPFSTLIGTPGRIQADYYLENILYPNRQYKIGSLATNETFVIYLPTIGRQDLWELFYDGSENVKEHNMMIDRMTLSESLEFSSDPLSISPEIKIHSIACLN